VFISGLGTAVPPKRYLQTQCWDVLITSKEFHQLKPRSRAILKKVLTGNNGIHSRYLALETLTQAFELTPDTLHERFLAHAPTLAAEAAQAALEQAKLERREVDALLISTCTGYLCPGLTSYVAERLKLRSNILALDLVGQGCGAALPNLRTAEALLASNGCEHVLSICVEVCSAAFYLDDDPGVLISACLFGDGAGAMVLSKQAGSGRRMEWLHSHSMHHAADRDLLRFEHRRGMLRNILSPEVPSRAGEHVSHLFAESLGESGLTGSQVTAWILHPGGREVLLSLRERLGLEEKELEHSAQVLAEHGNLSSASVYFVLRRALDSNNPGGIWWMSSFGAGFSAHGAFWQVE